MSQHATPLTFATLAPDQRAIVEAAAVLERFDADALAALIETPVEQALSYLLSLHPRRAAGDQYRLSEDLQRSVLATLDAEPQRLRELHGQAARHYAARLVAAAPEERSAIEMTYMRFLEGYCEALIQQEPTALSAVADAAPLHLLDQPRDRHLLRFYRGLGAGLQEHYDLAQAEFAGLLTEYELDDTIRGRVFNSGAIFARHQGDYERALEGYRQSCAIWERMGNKARQGLALMNQGNLNHLLQDYESAERDLHASLNLFRETDALHSEGLAQMNLGLLARDLGRWQEALSYFDQAGQIFKREGATNFLGHVANNIGEIEMLRGNLESALSHFERALDQMTTRTYAVDTHVNMGLVC